MAQPELIARLDGLGLRTGDIGVRIARRQILNACFYLAPNAALLSSECFWYHSFTHTCGFIRWYGPVCDLHLA